MKSTATLISETKAALATAEAAESREVDSRQIASDARWQAAENMAALEERGMTYRTIAAAVGMSDRTVGDYVRCWRKSSHARATTFTEVLKAVRGGHWGHEPASLEGKAKLTAKFVADPEVFADPKVIAAVTKAQKEASKNHLPPRPVEAKPSPRGLLAAGVQVRADYWTKFGWALDTCLKALEEARTEMRRSGLPEQRPGELVRKLRKLAADAARTEALLSESAIGEAAANQ